MATRIPEVRFTGVVFLSSEEEIDIFVKIVENISGKILVTFFICEDAKKSFAEKEETIRELIGLEKDLDKLFELCKTLYANIDKSNSSIPKFKEKEAAMQQCISNLKSLFKKVIIDKSSPIEQKITTYTNILEALVNSLQITLGFLQCQDEYKVNNILLCAQQSLVYIKQMRENQLDSEFERAKREGMNWFDVLQSMSSERVQVILNPTNQERLKTATKVLQKEIPNIKNLKRDFASIHPECFDGFIRATSEIISVVRVQNIEFNSCLKIDEHIPLTPIEILQGNFGAEIQKLLIAVNEANASEAIALTSNVAKILGPSLEDLLKEKAELVRAKGRELIKAVKTALENQKNEALFQFEYMNLGNIANQIQEMLKEPQTLEIKDSRLNSSLLAAGDRVQKAMQGLLKSAKAVK